MAISRAWRAGGASRPLLVGGVSCRHPVSGASLGQGLTERLREGDTQAYSHVVLSWPELPAPQQGPGLRQVRAGAGATDRGAACGELQDETFRLDHNHNIHRAGLL